MYANGPLIYVSPLIHGNLQYAEFPPAAVPEIVERSYLPTLEYFAANPDVRGVLEFSGVSLETMAACWPRTIELLRLLLSRGQIELLGSTYANPILPLIPTDHARRQLAEFWRIYDALFGDLPVQRPVGVFLQEFAYGPAVAPLLREAGYEYTILTPRLLLSGLEHGLNSAIKPLDVRTPSLAEDGRKLLHPLTLQGARGAHVAAFPLYREVVALLLDFAHGRKPFSQIAGVLYQAATAVPAVPPFLFLGPSDAEFIGVYDWLGKEAVSIEAFAAFMSELQQLPFVRLGLPGSYLETYPPQREVYVPAGTSERLFDVWTADADNVRLNALCVEAAQKLRLAAALHPEADELLDAAWREILLAENSDGRGWMPVPERRLACYDYALRAIELAEEILELPAGSFMLPAAAAGELRELPI